MVKAKETDLEGVLEGKKQYQVPLYQRVYSWRTNPPRGRIAPELEMPGYSYVEMEALRIGLEDCRSHLRDFIHRTFALTSQPERIRAFVDNEAQVLLRESRKWRIQRGSVDDALPGIAISR